MTSTPIDRVAPVATDTEASHMKQERESNIRVVVNRSTEAIDFDAWCASYVRDLIAADRAKQRQQQEAA